MRTTFDRDEVARLLAWKTSEGLTYARLEERTGISRHTLASWASRLRREARVVEEDPFVELVVADDPRRERKSIEIEVPGGIVVRVSEGFDPITLRTVLRALHDPC